MIRNHVCGVIVTFFPDGNVVRNIEAIRSQLEALIVVDNASSVESLQILRRAVSVFEFELIENERNFGIARALNIGVQRAVDLGFEWVAFFDQDSTAQPGFIEAQLSLVAAHEESGRIGLVGATYEYKATGLRPEPRLIAPDGGPVEIMTSGSLIPSKVFENNGFFREDFVIDHVDHEYGFRLRKNGYLVVRCREAILKHALGSPASITAFGFELFTTSGHNPQRRYYMARNGIILAKEYWRQHPAWTWKILRYTLVAPIKIILGEDRRWDKLCRHLLGVLHGAWGKTGQVIKL
jgi:rhamnosyltransferase